MDFINLSSSMTMLELVRYLLQDTNNSFSFYSGKLPNRTALPLTAQSEYNRRLTSVCQYICKKIREVWTVHNIGITVVDEGESMMCVTSPDPSMPAEVISFMVEAMSICTVSLVQDKSEMEVEENEESIDEIPSDLIQVNATMKEISERIQQFIRYKREQADANNVLDFCGLSSDKQFCARVDAVLVRKKDSSSHMAVRNVLDRYLTKRNTNRNDKEEKNMNMNTITQDHLSSGNVQSSFTPLTTTIDHKGEKRTYDIASLEEMLNSAKKQQLC